MSPRMTLVAMLSVPHRRAMLPATHDGAIQIVLKP